MNTRAKYEIKVDVRPTRVTSGVVEAPFDIAKRKLERNRYEVISLEQNAQLRIQQGASSEISRNGNWVREGVFYVPGKGRFLTKNSPIMQNPTKATNAHRGGMDFYLTDKQVEASLEDSVLLSESEIPTNRFGEDEITSYAFGKTAKQCGEFLRENGITSMPIYTTDLQNKSFVRPLWFGDLDYRSYLDGGGRDLHDARRLRGVKIVGGKK